MRVEVHLTGDDVFRAIMAWVRTRHNINASRSPGATDCSVTASSS